MEAGAQQRMEEFVMTSAFVMRVFIFILLGSQVDFALMGQYLVGGTLVVLILMLVARPITVFLCAGPDRRARWSLNELLFMCWTRETGVIPGALAGLLLGMKAPGAQMIAGRHLHRHSYDDTDPGADDQMAGPAGSVSWKLPSRHGDDHCGCAAARVPMTQYLVLKYLHVVGAAVLLGTGAGIAFFMLMAHLRGQPK